MYLKCHRREKDGKEHRYWSIAEKRRLADGRIGDRDVLYPGEINDSQRAARRKQIEAFDEGTRAQRPRALFPADREIPAHAAESGVQVRPDAFRLRRPRQWGACWTFCRLWEQLGLESFWGERPADSREGTSWYRVLMLLVAYRLIDPGSERRLHRHWYEHSAMGDLLGEGPELAAKNTLYRCPDRLLEHKERPSGGFSRAAGKICSGSPTMCCSTISPAPTSSPIRRLVPRTSVVTATRAIIALTACRCWSP